MNNSFAAEVDRIMLSAWFCCFPIGFYAQTFQLAPPQIRCDSVFFRQSARIELAFDLEGAEIHYTLDGTAPTAASPRYTSPLTVTADGKLRAMAVHPDFRPSEPVEIAVWRTRRPPAEAELSPLPGPDYPGRGAAGLFDGQAGSSDLRDGRWIGFAGGTVELTAAFPDPLTVRRVVVSTLVQPGAWIYPPRRIELWGRRKGGKWRRLAARQWAGTVLSPKAEPALVLSFQPRRLSELRLEVESFGPLPKGHPGAGKPAWLFMDEIAVD